MPHKGEVISEKDRRVPSVEVAQTIIEGLGQAVLEMDAAGIYTWTKDRKKTYQASWHVPGYSTMSDEEKTGLRQQRDAEGYVESADIRQDEQSRIVYARLGHMSPVRFLETKKYIPPFEADYKKTRLQFRYHDEGIGPRVIMDSWTVPYTKLTELHRDTAHTEKDYSELYSDLTRRHNAAGIPAGAENVTHWVFGRPDEVVGPREQRVIENLMNGFSLVVAGTIAQHKEIMEEIAAEERAHA